MVPRPRGQRAAAGTGAGLPGALTSTGAEPGTLRVTVDRGLVQAPRPPGARPPPQLASPARRPGSRRLTAPHERRVCRLRPPEEGVGGEADQLAGSRPRPNPRPHPGAQRRGGSGGGLPACPRGFHPRNRRPRFFLVSAWGRLSAAAPEAFLHVKGTGTAGGEEAAAPGCRRTPRRGSRFLATGPMLGSGSARWARLPPLPL